MLLHINGKFTMGIRISVSQISGRRGHDRILIGFTTTHAISAYHHRCFEFESRSVRGVHYVIKFVSDLPQVGSFRRVLRLPPPIKLTATIQLKYC
jgi:hypothetical protein